MSVEYGEIELSLKNPLSSKSIYVKDIKKYIRDKNNILIYLDDEPMPYCMKRSYFINLLIEDYDYACDGDPIPYYNLSKLFLNHKKQPKIIIKIIDIKSFFDKSISYFKLTSQKPIQKILTNTNVDKRKHAYDESKYDESKYDSYKDKKWLALASYCGYDYNGYKEINNYLVRLTDMPKYGFYDFFLDYG
jgi:hypothetical protein